MSQLKSIALALAALGLAAGAQAQTVTKDSVTGELRAPTADEAQALNAASKAGKRAAAPVGILSGRADPQPQRMPNGTVAQELTTDTMMYSVARKNADGTVSQYCVTGEEAAQRLVKAAPSSKKQTFAKAGKEAVYEVK